MLNKRLPSCYAEQSCQPQLLKDGTVRIVSGNALGEVLTDEQEPFDAIHVGAAAASMPQTLLKKLAPGGRMVRVSWAPKHPYPRLWLAQVPTALLISQNHVLQLACVCSMCSMGRSVA